MSTSIAVSKTPVAERNVEPHVSMGTCHLMSPWVRMLATRHLIPESNMVEEENSNMLPFDLQTFFITVPHPHTK